jgi:hypothetical protein
LSINKQITDNSVNLAKYLLYDEKKVLSELTSAFQKTWDGLDGDDLLVVDFCELELV